MSKIVIPPEKSTKQKFVEMLLTRHGANDRICVSAYKIKDGNTSVKEIFVDGVDAAAELIAGSKNPNVLAMWTNIQTLKSDAATRGKANIASYQNVLVDLDRKYKKLDAATNAYCTHGSGCKECIKVNATDDERVVLQQTMAEIVQFLQPYFGQPSIGDSGNGFHISYRFELEEIGKAKDYYRRILRVLKSKFEKPDRNVEIDMSLTDETQVATVWGTWNRKYPDLENRPQRQSKALSLSTQKPRVWGEVDLFLIDHESSEEMADRPGTGDHAANQCDAEWLENFGVPHLIDHFSPIITLVKEFDKSDGHYYSITPCYAHKEPREHTGGDAPEHSCIIDFGDGIGFKCHSGEFGIRTLIARMNDAMIEAGHEKYPERIFVEESDEDVLKVFSPVGELCLRQNCACGGIHQSRPSFDEDAGEFILGTYNGTSLIGKRVSDYKSRAMDFLWPERIPLGKGVIFHGPPSTAKSTCALSLIACITTGSAWPDGQENTMGARSVILAVTEDGIEDTIKPRLLAAGADITRVIALKGATEANENVETKREMSLGVDKGAILTVLRQNPDVVAVFLDPITGFFSGLKSNSNDEMRPVLEGISKICSKANVCFFGIVHENKRSDASAMDKILGAGAMVQVFRVALRFAKAPDGKGFVMAPTKSNLTANKGGLRYDVIGVDITHDDGRTTSIGKVVWGEAHEMDADDVIAASKNERESKDNKVELAKSLIRMMLETGPKPAKEIIAKGQTEGLSYKNLRSARYELNVAVRQMQKSWWWALTEADYEPMKKNPEPIIAEVDVL